MQIALDVSVSHQHLDAHCIYIIITSNALLSSLMKLALANLSMENLQAVYTLTPAWSWCFASSWADPKTTSCVISKAIGARRSKSTAANAAGSTE
jgi:hypothetical protein